MRSFAFVLVVASACYEPNTAGNDCRLACVTSDECPSELQCNSDRLCSVGGAACTGPLPDGPPGAICAGSPTGLFGEVCFEEQPAPIDLTAGPLVRIDTSDDPRCVAHPSVPDACLVVVDRIDVDLRAVGERPLVLWSSGDLVLAGHLDAAAHAGEGGPGTSVAPCAVVLTMIGLLNGTVGAGGAGGTFGSVGGKGGDMPAGQQNGGTPVMPVELQPALRAGCPGARGADTGGSIEETGGVGGGAVYLIAKSITITGTINVSGGGGIAAGSRCGGGGGGSGGMVGLDAQAIAHEGLVLALGGGGSSGAPNLTGLAGNEPTTTSAPFHAESTGSPMNCAGFSSGGAGSSGIGEVEGGKPGMSSCAGGGGGGGDGVIRVFGGAVTGNGILLPAPP